MHLIYIIATVSLTTLLGAWFFELVFLLEPCPLCLTQRLPHYAIVILGGIFAFYKRDEKAFKLLFIMLLLYSTGLASYHAGAEYGFWAGPTACGGAKPMITSTTDFLKSINDTKIIDCTAVQWKLFGISLAGYNAIISFIMLIALTFHSLQHGCRDRKKEDEKRS
jgi:disulfide bond formation protein DsbB